MWAATWALCSWLVALAPGSALRANAAAACPSKLWVLLQHTRCPAARPHLAQAGELAALEAFKRQFDGAPFCRVGPGAGAALCAGS